MMLHGMGGVSSSTGTELSVAIFYLASSYHDLLVGAHSVFSAAAVLQ